MLITLSLLLSVAVGTLPGVSKAQAAKKPIIMKVAHAQPEHTPRHKSYLRFKELVEKRSSGDIRVEIYPHGQLGIEHDVTEQVKLGTIQSTRSGSFEMITPTAHPWAKFCWLTW